MQCSRSHCLSYRIVAVLTALSGASSVMLGALGAHRLTLVLDARMLHVYDTALRYQVWHTLALLAVVLWASGAVRWRAVQMVCLLWWAGMLLFSGSLYALALTDLPVGLLTPSGGLVLMAGWLLLAWQAGRGALTTRKECTL